MSEGERPTCPRCAMFGAHDDCQVCATLNSGVFPAVVIMTVVVQPTITAPRRRPGSGLLRAGVARRIS